MKPQHVTGSECSAAHEQRSRSTIFALSSGSGRAAIALIRISGPAAGAVLDTLAPPRPAVRRASLRRITPPDSSKVIDEALVLWLPGPGTETGEDMAEIHVHGGRAVVAATLAAIGAIDGCRPAEPGEFSRRAFDNGRIDFTAAEGLADLIEAETEAQRRAAIRQAQGGLARLYDGWRGELLSAMALVEAGIDFSDEADVSAAAIHSARQTIASIRAAVTAHLGAAARGEIEREGLRVVIAGPPNAGKSTLLNALARRDVAIVSPEPGTTRDVLEVRLDLAGYMVVLSDTAGIRDTESALEREGIRRAEARMADAHLVLWLEEAGKASDQGSAPNPAKGRPHGNGAATIHVATKRDLAPSAAVPAGAIALSAHTGEGLDLLTLRIAAEAKTIAAEDGDAPAPSQPRHRHHLARALDHLRAFLDGPENEVELRAEDLRLAAGELGRLTGRIDPEAVLDQIFARFCIGK